MERILREIPRIKPLNRFSGSAGFLAGVLPVSDFAGRDAGAPKFVRRESCHLFDRIPVD
jgi:hypothetical protein